MTRSSRSRSRSDRDAGPRSAAAGVGLRVREVIRTPEETEEAGEPGRIRAPVAVWGPGRVTPPGRPGRDAGDAAAGVAAADTGTTRRRERRLDERLCGGPARRAPALVLALAALLAVGPAACGPGGEAGTGGRAAEGGVSDTAASVGGGVREGRESQEGRALTEVNRFLSYAAADSVVDLKLWAGYGGANSAWNFDGYHHGGATVVVPAGWRVEVTYQTLDANVPHSAAVVETREEIPASGDGVRVAFPGASTPSFTTGLTSNRDPVQFAFRADEAGRYWIFCGVPGHAVGGMWIWLEVSDAASAPDFRTDGEG